MEFPRLVFTSPGPNKCGGGTYGHELVRDEKELKAALEVGFFETIPEALEALKDEKEPFLQSNDHVGVTSGTAVEGAIRKTNITDPPKKAEQKAKAEK